MKIEYLKDYKEWIPTIAQWFYNEWSDMYPELHVDKIILRIQTRTNVDKIPLALVALENNAVIGTASLKKFDMDTRMQYSPWLASVYVKEERRGTGVGTHLVRAIENTAKNLGIKILYLYTPDAQDFYAKLGWCELETTEYRGRKVTIMIKNLS